MAGIVYTYTTLTTALQDMLEDSFTDFTAFQDQLIGWGELKLIRDLKLDLWDTVSTDPVTDPDNRFLTKPAGTIAIKMVEINGLQLESRTHEYIKDYNASAASGQPRYFNDFSETLIEMAPPPDAAYATEWQTVGRPLQISADVPTTFLSTYYGDVLMLACLIECERFELADERIPIWQGAYAEKLSGAIDELKENLRISGLRPLIGMPQPTPAQE